MLSRVADSLFWMSRYLERAEVTARGLDVAFSLAMDLSGLVPENYAPPWVAILEALQQKLPSHLAKDPHGITAWLALNIDNPDSVIACVNRARNNARSIRGRISSEVWRSLNQLYWTLRDAEFAAVAEQSPHEYFTIVQTGAQQFQGVCDATLPHDEGWHFLQLGRHLERASQTICLLDVQYRRLTSLNDSANEPLAVLEWAGVLKCCNAYEAYQRIAASRVERDRVLEYLQCDAESPRSVRFSLEAAAQALACIDRADRGDHPAEKALGRVISDLRYADLPLILASDFHEFLSGLLLRCSQASAAIQDQYSLVH